MNENTKEQECTFDVCRCGHFDSDHEGFFWFHMTACKVKDCNCQKYLKIQSYTWDNVPDSTVREGVVI